MHKRDKSPPQGKKRLITVIILLVIGIFIWGLTATSKLLSNRERVTIGVYAPHPFALSYNKHSHIVTVIWFNPRTQVYVPGGYRWYPFGSVHLLDSIEKKKGELVRRTFEELIGAPVDFVVVPRTAGPLPEVENSFVTFFYSERGKLLPLLGGVYRVSSGNSIDRYLLAQILRARNDKLLFIDASGMSTISQRKSEGLQYDSDKLDQILKGYLYWPSIDHTNNVRIEVGDSEYYGAAVRIGRMVEGMGIKVIDITIVIDKAENKECVVSFGASKKNQGEVLAQHFANCSKNELKNEQAERGIIVFFVGRELGKLYR